MKLIRFPVLTPQICPNFELHPFLCGNAKFSQHGTMRCYTVCTCSVFNFMSWRYPCFFGCTTHTYLCGP